MGGRGDDNSKTLLPLVPLEISVSVQITSIALYKKNIELQMFTYDSLTTNSFLILKLFQLVTTQKGIPKQ